MTPTVESYLSCDYCGLPLPQAVGSASKPSGKPQSIYCCFGCRFAAEVTGARGEEGEAGWAMVRLGLAIFLSMNVMVFTMALWTQDLYPDTATDAETSTSVIRSLFRYLCMLFALPVLFLLGGPLLVNAWSSVRRGLWNTDLLLVVGVAASYLYSTVSVIRESGPVYFEVGCAVLVLVTLGRWLEATGKLRTTSAIAALHRLLPERARRLSNDGETEVLLGEVQVGDRLRVLPGERVPCDGRVLHHALTVDQQSLTGESQPTIKEPGDMVLGGSLNLQCEGYIEAISTAAGGALVRLIDLVQQARRVRTPYERLADRLSSWFLPIILMIAAAAFGWHAWRWGLDHGIMAALAVLLIACPCALGLATPMAVWAALGRAARAGIVFRNGEALERLASIRAVRLDKTGTLTTGTPTVAGFTAVGQSCAEDVLRRAARLAAASTHGYSQAIQQAVGSGQWAETRLARPSSLLPHSSAEELEIRDGPYFPWHEIRTLPGRGVVACAVSGTVVASLGSLRLMAEKGLSLDEKLSRTATEAEENGLSVACLGSEEAVEGIFTFQEMIRPEAVAALAELRELGLDVAVLTGDSTARGKALGEMLGVAVSAELLPEAKIDRVIDARHRLGSVAMVGDGINDAPALAASDVGMAMGCGTDVARESAVVCLLGNDLRRIPWSIRLAQHTVRVIRQNLFWAFAYNVVGVGFACTGKLNPIIAALAMVLSSFLVVSNSLKLGRDNV